MKAEPARIVIADDHAVVRDAIAHELTSRVGYAVLALCNDGEQALEAIRRERPDLALLDVSMPRRGGLSVAREVQRERWPCKVVLLTMHADVALVQRARLEGVSGLVRKEDALTELHTALAAVLGGSTHWPAFHEARASEGPLTPRENEVCRLVAQGLSARQVGDALGISPRTVEVHRARMMRKLGATSLADVIRFAIRAGMVDL